MKYRVTFRQRFTPQGEPADDPESLIDPGDGVIEAREFLEIVEPAGIGVVENLNEDDDGFLGLGTETWVYDVAEGREKEFTDSLVESKVVLDFEELPDDSLTT